MSYCKVTLYPYFELNNIKFRLSVKKQILPVTATQKKRFNYANQMKKILFFLIPLCITQVSFAQFNDYEESDYSQNESSVWTEIRGGYASSLKSIQFVSASYAIFLPVNDTKMLSLKLGMQQGVSGDDPGSYNNIMLGMMFTGVWGETHKIQASGGLGFAFMSEPVRTNLGVIKEPKQLLIFPLELSFFPKQKWKRKTGVITNIEFTPLSTYLGLGLVVQLRKKENYY